VRALLHRSHALRKPVPLGCVLTIAAGTASGLDYAHERLGRDGRPLNIVHRDVSPSNLMVSFDGGVKILDFGVAKAADRMQDTRSGTVKGKIAYLSPEQCRGVPVDRRSDLFSFGIVVWEMLTTERLYRRGSDFDNMTAIVNELPPPPSVKRPDITPELDAIVLKLLAKDPDQRFQTAGEAVEAIEQIAAQSGSVLSTAGLGRQLRELFGQRPEPWIELESLETHEGVTVTGEPVIGASIDSKAAGLELQLAGIPSIGPHAVEMSGPMEQPPMLPMTVPPSQSAPLPIPQQHPITVVAPLDYPRVDRRTARVSEPPPIAEAERRPRRIAFVIAGAAVIGIIVGVSLAVRSGGDSRVAGDRPDAPIIVHAPDPPAGNPAAVAPADAPVAVAVDAAITIAEVPVDAAEAAARDDAAVASAPADAGTGHKQPPHPAPTDLSKLFAAAKYREVVDACRTSASDRGLCALAACHSHELDWAKRFARGLTGASRTNLLAACKKLGLDLDPAPPPVTNAITPPPPPPKPDCETNPLACQHP
jgi:hypothetical protein